MSELQANGSPLRRLLENTAAEHGVPMKDLTVLAVQNDPFRVDTPAGHRDGEWLATNAERLGLARRKIHLRGLHYALVTDAPAKPNGETYRNVDADWRWLQEKAADAARWLGYIPFDRIVDQRNAEPVVRIVQRKTPWPYLSVGVDVDIPDASGIEPRVDVAGFSGVQPYRIVMIGEKSSLGDVLGPIAKSYGADLYLPTGEISDTHIHQIAKAGADDGRPMVVLYFSDADPAGWQMPISVGRKLQAFKVGFFPDLEFQEHRVALTPDQVREYGLPSTPLKRPSGGPTPGRPPGVWPRPRSTRSPPSDRTCSGASPRTPSGRSTTAPSRGECDRHTRNGGLERRLSSMTPSTATPWTSSAPRPTPSCPSCARRSTPSTTRSA